MENMSLNFPDKKYLKIGEASQIADLEPHVLRFWESEFKNLSPKKDSGNQRLYTRKDLELIFEIKKLLYDESYTIAGARKKISKSNLKSPKVNVKSSGDKNSIVPAKMKKSLAAIKSGLEEIKEILSN